MNLPDIEAFVAVAETGSLNRAALRLNITQPAVTRRIQNFEATIGGGVLLDRASKPPVLTPAGKQALEKCRRVLRAVADLAISAAAEEPAGDLRIGIAHGLAEVVLTSPLDALRQRFSNVKLHLSSDWTTRLIEDVRTGALDCAVGLIVRKSAVPPSVDATPLGPEPIVVVTAREAKLRARGPVRLRDLENIGWTLNPPGCGCRAALQHAFDRAKIPMNVSADVFGEEFQLSLIAHSGGLGLAPRRRFEASPNVGRLRTLRVSDFNLQATITMLRGPSLGRLTGAVQELQSQIIERINR